MALNHKFQPINIGENSIEIARKDGKEVVQRSEDVNLLKMSDPLNYKPQILHSQELKYKLKHLNKKPSRFR